MEMLVFFIDKQLKGQYTLSLYSNTSLARGQTGYSKDIIPCQYTQTFLKPEQNWIQRELNKKQVIKISKGKKNLTFVDSIIDIKGIENTYFARRKRYHRQFFQLNVLPLEASRWLKDTKDNFEASRWVKRYQTQFWHSHCFIRCIALSKRYQSVNFDLQRSSTIKSIDLSRFISPTHYP